MKIDLHCHTKKTKQGDANTRNVTADKFVSELEIAGVSIAAITNHNAFDKEQYIKFQMLGQTRGIQVWPGVELDVKSNTGIGHVIVVSNPCELDEFTIKINQLINGETPDSLKVSVESLITFVNSLDCLILAHYKKPKSLDEITLNTIRERVNDKSRFFYEPGSYRSLGILNNHDYYSILGSDVSDWDKYSQYELAELKLEVDSFSKFMQLIKKDPKVVNTLLNKKTKYEIDISYKSEDERDIVPIYDDVNIIFGTKGTGKSEALKKIKEYFASKNIDYSFYTPNNNDDEINSKLEVKDIERKLSGYDLDNMQKQFDFLGKWKEGKTTSIKNYRDAIEADNKNAAKRLLKITASPVYQGNTNDNLLKIETDKKNVNQILNKMTEIDINKYLRREEQQTLFELLEKLKNNVLATYEHTWLEYEAIEQSNKLIEKMKSLVEEKTETKVLPSKTGLYDFIDNRLSLYLNVSKIIDGFSFQENSSPVYIGDLGENKKLYSVRRTSMLNKTSKTEEFTIGINKLKSAKKAIIELKEHSLAIDVNEKLSNLKIELADNEIQSLDDFLGVKKVFTLSIDDLENIVPYSPSSGEATMIVLLEKLQEDVDVFILDEPEKSLGNTYVNDILVPQLVSLARKKKVVVAATHNANIAVRTFPYTSILKKYDNGHYYTYVGNSFTNELIPNSKNLDTLDWKNESIRILEGGKEAFEERGEIYNG